MGNGTDEPQGQDPDVPDDQGGKLFRTVVDGRWVTVPATIAGIREALPEERREAFTKTIEETPARDLFATMARWASTPEMDAALEREHDRIQRLGEEADARVIMGEDPDVVRSELQSRLRNGT
ncbi:hypothetical protein [Embleya scabrispora]|uniref:hypothetical protein n=1 Tax=Embleya scabrispora TaxID=159449 RepID=UPI000364E410|nr:hypothetical protein [Embleya scabrispora]MYS83327.1 hypothetical protein [Streptomyces sp. SID5474]